MGRAQQMMLEHGLQTLDDTPALPTIPGFTDKATMARAQEFWLDSMKLWQRFLDPASAPAADEPPERAKDRRFQAPQWHENPVFRSKEHTSELQSLMRISYAVFCLQKKTTKP